MRILFFSLMFFCIGALHAQNTVPTYFQSGVNSPWALGIDYDLGFSGIISYHMALLGGLSSQVNEAANFGDIYFAELQIGLRFYLAKKDTWRGTYFALVGRVGYYDLPLRVSPAPIVFQRVGAILGGGGVYLGYRWFRNLVSDMKGFPFILAFEPYLGYNFETMFAFNGVGAIAHRFTVGLRFTLGFYTHKYTPGTRVTNQDTGEITKVEDSTEGTNGTNTSSTNTLNQLKDAPVPKTDRELDTFGYRGVRGRDPWEQLFI